MGKADGSAARTMSRRRRAAIVLAQLRRVAKIQRAHGAVIDRGPWLKVLANVLSSAPAGCVSGGKRKAQQAPDCWELSYKSLLIAAERCGLNVSDPQEIAAQVMETSEWRAHETQRIGRPHYIMMRSEKMGELIGLTEEIWRAAKAWNLAPHGSTKESRKEARRERDKMRKHAKRRAEGMRPQGESLSNRKPWEAEGICRRTWERRRAKADDDGRLEGDGTNCRDQGVATLSATNKVSQLCPPQLCPRPISTRVATLSATNIDNTASGLLSSQTTPESGDGIEGPTENGTVDFANGFSEVDPAPACDSGAPAEGPEAADEASRKREFETAIEKFRRLKGAPAPPRPPLPPGGLAARALALVRELDRRKAK